MASLTEKEIEEMTLADFVAREETVAFNALLSPSFRHFVEERPYLKLGQELASGYVPVYTDKKEIPDLFKALGSDYTGFYPQILSPLAVDVNSSAGITEVLEHPYLKLSGKGVLVGIIDTGIDYTKDAFCWEDGKTKIERIWDQSLEGSRGEELYYGAEYFREDIDRALESQNPFEIVPTRDEDGHGTFLAATAAGRGKVYGLGSAPEADLVVVKLRRAHPYYIDKFLLPKEEKNLFESSDVLLACWYIFRVSQLVNKPVVICLGLGSNSTGHDGNSALEEYISIMCQRIGVAVVTAGGNESNARHHTQGSLSGAGARDVISLRVGENMASFTMGIYGAPFDRISVGIASPTGEVISPIPFKVGLELAEELTIDKTKVSVGYYKDVNTVIILGFDEAKEGIWEISLYGDRIVSGAYDAWLPMTGQVSDYVEFMKPVPDTTVVYPATSLRSITCGAYSSYNNTLYVSSSWGPTRLPRIAPDLVAPGVEVRGVFPWGYGTMTGSSVSAAITAGAVALLLEWGLVQRNMLSMDGDMVRLLLIAGLSRDEGMIYPNTRWGYGKLNLFGTFFSMKESSIIYDKL